MRSIPNMRILEVGDASEVESVSDVADAIDGHVYIRMVRGEVPRLFDTPMKFGVTRALSEGTDVAVITTGICTEQAILARKILSSPGVLVLHLHLSTIVPFPPMLSSMLRQRSTMKSSPWKITVLLVAWARRQQ